MKNTCDCEMVFISGRKKRDARRTGTAGMSEYTIWAGIRYRCNPKSKSKTRSLRNIYLGRVKISSDWAASFFNFYRDIGPRPGKEFSVERKDGTHGYCKHNCEWETAKAQGINRALTRNKGPLPRGIFRERGVVTFKRIVRGREFYIHGFSSIPEAIKVSRIFEFIIRKFGQESGIEILCEMKNENVFLT